MRDIKHKINMHIHIAVGRIRFIRNTGRDAQGNVEQILKLLRSSVDEGNILEDISEDMRNLFTLDNNQYIDRSSIWNPRKNRVIKQTVTTEVGMLTQEEMDDARIQMQKETFNPYSKRRMKLFLDSQMGNDNEIDCSVLPMNNRQELLSDISAVAYGEENGFEISVGDGYIECDDLLLRRFTVRRK